MEIFYTIYFLYLKPIDPDDDKLKDNREYLIRLDELIEGNHFREFINEYKKKTLDSPPPFIGAKETVNFSDVEYPEKINNLLKAIKNIFKMSCPSELSVSMYLYIFKMIVSRISVQSSVFKALTF